jgi:hypothetical protein
MRKRRSRLTLIGVMALALCVTLGLMVGAADAKKKGKKKSKRSFTVTKTTPTVVPGAPGPGGVAVKLPIGTVGKKAAKGKVVSLNGVRVTSTFTGAPGFVGSGGTITELVGPSGRDASLVNPVPNNSGTTSTETASGPLTETPNSIVDVCIPSTPSPPPPCVDPDATLGPPYSGTVGNSGLLNFSGSSARGTWMLKVFNFGDGPVTVNSVSVTGGLITKPR